MSRAKIRIIFVITSLSTGGAEMMLLKLLQNINRHRFEPLVISLTSLGDIGLRILSLGISVQALGMKRSKLNFLLFLRLYREIRNKQPDIVHTWLYHSDLLAGLASKLAGVRIICWGIRSSNLDANKTRYMTRVLRRCCALLSYLIPQQIFLNSEEALRIHKSIGYSSKKLMVIPNGFDLDLFRPDSLAREKICVELNKAPDKLLVGMIGRYDPLKNQTGFVSVMKIIYEQVPNIIFILAGKNIDHKNKELVGLLESAGLLDVVELLGIRQDMPEIMASLDVLACPSHAEAFPNVVGEAMACGVPCVATNVGDSAYIIGDTGFVVPPNDMETFSKFLLKMLLTKREERYILGKAARIRVTSLFKLSNVVRRYEEVYLKLTESSYGKQAAF